MDAAYASRPLALQGPPVAIYAPVFAEFRQLAQQVDLTAEELDATFGFVVASTAFYENEPSRTQAITKHLNKLVNPTFLRKAQYRFGDHQAEPDGASEFSGNHFTVPKSVNELKNGIGEGDSDALEQGICDYKSFLASTDVGSKAHVFCLI